MIRSDAITLKQLRALIAVSRAGSMTGAGAALSLTTPAIHSQIKGLEAAVAAPLVRRAADGAGSELTAAGRELLEAAMRIEGVLSQAAANLAAVQRGEMGRVVLGVVSTAKYFAPRLVRMLRDSHPEIEVALQIGNRDWVMAELERESFDLAIMGRPPRYPAVVADPIGPHPHGIVAAPDHPLAARAEVTAEDLLDQTFLVREDGSGTRILMTRYLDRIGEGRMPPLVEMGTNETIKQAVMAGLGIAFLSLHTVTDERASGRLVTLRAPGLPLLRHWFLVRPADMPERAVTERLRSEIMSLNGRFLPEVREPAGFGDPVI